MSDDLDLAVRAYTAPTTPPGSPTTAKTDLSSSTDRFPEHVLIFDTETTIDAAQALNFGAWRYCRVRHTADGVELRCVQEGLFYADDLPQRDPTALAVLREHARSHRGDVDVDDLDASPTLLFQSQSEFLERIFFRVAFRLRGAVIAFNFPFDLSRVAWQAGMTRNRRPDRRDALRAAFPLRSSPTSATAGASRAVIDLAWRSSPSTPSPRSRAFAPRKRSTATT